MKHKHSKPVRIMAIALSTSGFGYAVLDEGEKLVVWGVKTIREKNKNAVSLTKVEKLVAHYLPDKIILEDHSTKDSRRSKRIKKLSRDIIALAERRKVKAGLFTHKQIRRAFFTADDLGTKHERAEIIAQRFPEELGPHLPPKRRPWTNENYWMCTFDAVALALVPQLRQAQKRKKADSTIVAQSDESFSTTQ